MNWLFVLLGGALGSSLRYAISLALPVQTGQFPWATWWANILGCGLAGAFLALSEKFMVLQGNLRLFLLVGILGGFTTFSSFNLETFTMLRDGHLAMALSYVLTSLAVGLAALAFIYYCFRCVILS